MNLLLLFMFRVCHAFLFAHCSLVVTCLERASLLALMCVMFYCFFTFPCGVLGWVWNLIVSISDLCLLTYLDKIPNTVKHQLYEVPGTAGIFWNNW